MKDIDSENACKIVFAGDEKNLQGCLNHQNKLFQSGLRNVYQNTYYYELNEYVSFES